MGVAMTIKLKSDGPIIFRQKRTGFNGSIFEIWKFRSMHAEKTDLDAAPQSARSDPQATRVERFIRRTSLDELPQIFNVLQGEMSAVGTRPHTLKTRADGQLVQDLLADYAASHRVKPGVSGWAQINGLRGELDLAEKLRPAGRAAIEHIEK